MPKKIWERACSDFNRGIWDEIWQSPITQCRFPVSVTVLSKNTANAILKQAGLDARI
jgi:hypothetical protein